MSPSWLTLNAAIHDQSTVPARCARSARLTIARRDNGSVVLNASFTDADGDRTVVKTIPHDSVGVAARGAGDDFAARVKAMVEDFLARIGIAPAGDRE